MVSWVPADVNTIRGVIFFHHGLHEHILRYSKVARAFVGLGYAFFGYDCVGHGASHNGPYKTRALIEDYKTIPADFVAFVAYIRKNHDFAAQRPAFVVAHSMGTMAVSLAINSIPDIAAVVLTGCAIVVGPSAGSPFGVKALYPLTKTSAAVSLTRTLAGMDPMGDAAPIFLSALSTDPAVQERVQKDPRHYRGSIKNKSAFELIKMTLAVKEEIPNIAHPIYLLHGGADTICLPEGSQFYFDHVKTPADLKKLEIFPNLFHEISFEERTSAELVLNHIDTFLSQFAPAAPSTIDATPLTTATTSP